MTALVGNGLTLASLRFRFFKVSQGTDDCLRSLSPDYFSLTLAFGSVGFWLTNNFKYGCGLRFANVRIPKGAIIDSAVLRVNAYGNDTVTPVNTEISGHKVPNSPTFTTKEDFDNRRFNERTEKLIYWDNVEPFYIGNWYESPDINSVISEIVHLPDWVIGNAIVLFWDDFADRTLHITNARRRIESYNHEPTEAPILYVNWHQE